MGPGRTGVKGVIRDRAEAESLARAKRADEIKELNRAMEKASLGGKTWAEEEKERLAKIAAQEGRSTASSSKAARGGSYGHLREVGVRSFVQAVEEDQTVWVVVHIYDPVSQPSSILEHGIRVTHTRASSFHSHCLSHLPTYWDTNSQGRRHRARMPHHRALMIDCADLLIFSPTVVGSLCYCG